MDISINQDFLMLRFKLQNQILLLLSMILFTFLMNNNKQ